MRQETDGLGSLTIRKNAYFGIHTQRAINNFEISGYRLHPALIIALAQVKEACARTNCDLGDLKGDRADAIIRACREIADGKHRDNIVVDPFQGGAGTSTNMNINEVIANRALELLGHSRGEYEVIHPIHDVNMHQSTNDVYPTAVRVAALTLLKHLEKTVSELQESMQAHEKTFRDVIKLGRTQLQDAVPMTLGMTFGAFAEAVSRDRWRIFKCRERIKQVNLGGTAIGTGLGAPREYIFRVTDVLRQITGLNVSRAENLLESTQNLDPFVETSGMLKTYAANLHKIATDLRLLASGPRGGIGELSLPAVQSGSSIMPGKINPVIPEMISQVAFRVIANDQVITLAAASGNLELNQFFPVICFSYLESLQLLIHATEKFDTLCIQGITADPEQCRAHVEQSRTLATVLVPILGYSRVETLVKQAETENRSIQEILIETDLFTLEQINDLLSPRRMQKLGYDPVEYDGIS